MSVRVVLRCKPSSEGQLWRTDKQENSLNYTGEELTSPKFTFSQVFDESTTHSELYDQAIAPKVTTLLDGSHSNLAVIAYGSPCGGKSHTIFGTTGQTRVKQEARGIIYRCGQQLLAELQHKQTDYCVSVSFLQIFDDGRVADLFDTKKRNLELVANQATLQYTVSNLTHQNVTFPQDVLRLVEKGYLMRNATGCVREPAKKVAFASAMKPLPLQQYRPHSTHAVFTYTVQYQIQSTDQVQVVHASIADLAGKSINELNSSVSCSDKGIETLEKVIQTLSSQGVVAASSLFPKSSLTKILKPCFGGNCDTAIIANVSTSERTVDISKCMELLSNAQKIKNYSKKTTMSLSQSALGKADQPAIVNSDHVDGGTTMRSEVEMDPNERSAQQLARKPFESPPEDEARSTHTKGSGGFTDNLRLKGRKPPVPLSSLQGKLNSAVKPPQPRMAARRIQPAPPSPLFVSVRAHNRADSTKSEQSISKDDSSDDSLSLDSDTDSDSANVLPTPVSAGPPPPPLRGIPHFNPDSPVSSQLTSTPLIPSAMSRPLSAPRHSKAATIQPPSPAKTPTSVTSMSLKSASSLASTSGRANTEYENTNDLHTNKHTQEDSVQQEQKVSAATEVPPHLKTSELKVRRTLFKSEEDPDDNTMAFSPQTYTKDLSLKPLSPLTLISKPQLPAITQVLPSLSRAPQTGSSQSSSKVVSSILPTSTSTSHEKQVQNVPKPSQVGISTKESLRKSEGSLGDVSNTSSSLTITSDSEDELSDEARDLFNPNMQQRALSMPRQGYGGHSASHPPVLPPILSPSHLPTVHRSPTHPPHTHHQLAPIEHPPSYTESSPTRQPSSSRLVPLPVYNSPSRGSVSATSSETSPRRSDNNSPEGGVIDLTHYMSSEEIHIAAMEGVRGSEMKRLAIQYGVDYKDQGGRTSLMYAVLGNQPKMCEILIKLRAAINVKDCSGLTPLLWSTYLARAEVVKVLLKNGADVHCTDSDGRTIYHWAMKTPNLHCLKWLCKYANFPTLFNKLDNESLTPLHWAVMTDQASHVRLLLTSTSADVSIKDKECRPPLNYAVLNFSPACIRAILENRESAVNLTDNKGRTALHYACAEGSADCVRTLLSFRSCDLHCTDNSGTTPLHWAAAANQPGLIQLLVRRGADRAQLDNSDMTPLDHAKQRNHVDCIKILQTYGLRRPSSALSIASHVSLPTHGGAPPTFDEQGHVILRRPNRRFSLSGVSVSSIDRSPADGQAGSEEGREDGVMNGECDITQTIVPTDQTSQQSLSPANAHRRWSTVLCCGGRRSNTVAPM